LEACNSVRDSSTLFHQSDAFNVESDYDTVDKSIQSSRHVDVFKVWLMWRAKGQQGYEAQIEQLMDLSRYDSDSTHRRYVTIRYAMSSSLQHILPHG